jgi:hypothetical protein
VPYASNIILPVGPSCERISGRSRTTRFWVEAPSLPPLGLPWGKELVICMLGYLPHNSPSDSVAIVVVTADMVAYTLRMTCAAACVMVDVGL